ncbi:MAG: DUF3899 domain-containing protein [Oscillospiraceae bacterium]
MSRKKKTWITCLVLAAVAAVVVLITACYERSSHGPGAAQAVQYLSDGFFTISVLYIGCSLLMYIQEAGNFYGIQFLFYTLFRLFSSRGKRYEEKKDYYTYCTEKKTRRETDGPSPLKKAMLLVGLVCLVLAVGFVLAYYRMNAAS